MIRGKTASILVIALICSLLAPAGGSWTSVAAAASGKYLHLNFEEYPAEPSLSNPASTPDGGGSWSFFGTVAGSVYGIGEALAGGSGRGMSIVSNVPPDQSVNNPNIQKNNLTIPGSGNGNAVIVMEGRFRTDNTLLERRLFSATLTQSPGTATVGELRVTMDKTGKMGLLYPSPGGNVTEPLGTYEGGVWYHVQLYANLATRQLTAYVNGALKATVALSAGWDNFRSFRFTQLGSAGTPGKLTLDDVKVYDWIPVEAMTVDRAALQLAPGGTSLLTASYAPADSTNRYATWASDHPEVATVDERGMVSAVAAGTATITATSKESGSIMASSFVTVAEYTRVESVTVTPAALQLETERTGTLTASMHPSQATHPEAIWSSDDPSVATVDELGIVTAVGIGTVVITATSQDGPSGQSVVTVVQRSTPVESVTIPSSARVNVGDTLSVTPRYSPEDATNPVFHWNSDNSSVAVVDSDGVVTGLAPGIATVTATAQGSGGAVFADIEIIVSEPALPSDAFDELRLKWKAMLDGGPDLETAEPSRAAQIRSMNELALSRWETLQRGENRASLWADVPPSETDSAFINTYMTRLRDMAYAYSTKGGRLYRNVTMRDDMLSALDWIYEHAYNERVEEYGNWWNFDIGAPLRVMDIMVMLYDEMTEAEIARFIRTADKFIGNIAGPEFTQVGANRSDIMTIEALMGILAKDSDRLSDVLSGISPLFDNVAEGDGFYEDGSFIQHKTIPYTGSYGEVLIRGLGQLLYLLDGSPWTVTDPDAGNVYRWIFESVAPVAYRGEMMDMVRGRAIAREFLNGRDATVGMISGMLRLAMSAPASESVRIRELIKYWVMAIEAEVDVYAALRLDLIAPLEAIMEDASIVPLGDLPFHKEFGAMNRTVHVADGFGFGISKSSERIATYELTNGENGEGWYTGDGMTYLYNGDASHYSDDYWPTVNRYRLPGTTVDTRARINAHYQYGDGETTPDNSWAGGATLGTDGISGMNLRQVGTTLQANKSWFMFGDVVVALGSGINSSDGRTIETIVEQRKINADGTNALIVDGEAAPAQLGWNDTLSGVKWANLAGTSPGAGIGYYFPDAAELRASRTANSGSWYAINQNAATSTDMRTRNYVSLWFDHGSNPVNQTYGYVLLPNRTPEETEAFAESPTISILENSEAAHAVRDVAGGITGINFWRDAKTTSAGVTSSRQASVMLKEGGDDTLDVAVSDPSFDNSGVIELEIERSAASVLSADEEVTVTQLHPTIKLLVSVENSFSRSFQASFDLDPAKERPEPQEAVAPIENVKEPLGTALPVAHLHTSFDQEQPGNRPSGLVLEEDRHTLGTVESPDGGVDHALKLMDRNPDGSATATGRFPEQDGTLALSWKYADPGGDSGLRFRVLGGEKVAAELFAKPDGLYRLDENGAERLVFGTRAARWYTIDMRLNAERQEWMLDVNGSRVPGVFPFSEELEALDGIQFRTGMLSENAVVYVDDIVVYVTGATTLVADGFEGYTDEEWPGDWTVVERVPSAPAYVWHNAEERNSSLLLDDNDTSFRAAVSRTFEPQSGRLIAEWSYKELLGGKYPEFQLLSGSTRVVRLTSSSNNYLRYFGLNASANTVIDKAPTKAKQWHAVKLDVDIPGRSYDLYFDGALAQSDVPFFGDAASIDGILFGSGYGAADAKLYVDNVKVYHLAGEIPPWETDGAGGEEPSPTPTSSTDPTSTSPTEPTPTSTPSETNAPISTPNPSGTSAPSPGPTPSLSPSPSPGGNGGGADESGATISAEELLELLQAGTSSWRVRNGGHSFEVPIEALRKELDRLVTEKNVKLADLSVSAAAATSESREKAEFARKLDRSGLEAISEIVNFRLTIHAGKETIVIREFGNRMSERIIEVEASVDLSKAIALMHDSWMGDIRFVPAKFEEIDGVKRAAIGSAYTGMFVIAEAREKTFEDIAEHWARADIESLASRFILQGKTDAGFEPETSMTRAEFMALLARAVGLKEDAAGAAFADVAAGAWHEGWIGAAYAAGLVTGYGDGTFKPDAKVSREEMGAMLARALSYAGLPIAETGTEAGTETEDGNSASPVRFLDRHSIAPWARNAVTELVRLGILQGLEDSSFAPKDEMTRAQAASAVVRLLRVLGFL